jgi:integration host factor subunit alpha
MDKLGISREVAKELDITPKEAKPIVEAIFGELKAAIENGINVEISGFGKFVIRHKNARIGRNPKTGEEAEVTERKVVNFKPSQVFKKAVDGSK